MKSMTGYAALNYENEGVVASLEIKAVNNRYLDLYIHIPKILQSYEMEIRELLSSTVKRGKLNFSLDLKIQEMSSELTLNKDVASACYKMSEQLADQLQIPNDLRISDLLHLPGVMEQTNTVDAEYIWESLQTPINELIESFDSSRKEEGDATSEDLLTQINNMEQMCGLISQKAAQYTSNLKDQLTEKLEQTAGELTDRYLIIQEAAIIANRSDINEEISRLQSHFNLFKDTLKSGEPVGRKLDFICQEINREVNTVGSKQHQYEITESVVELKSNLEKIKEQIRNVE